MAPYLAFSALVQAGTRAYMFAFDEALRNGYCNAQAMLRDPVIYGALRNRMMPTAQLSFHIDPDDDTDEVQAEAAVRIKELVERIDNWQGCKFALMWAIWYGRAGVEINYEWEERRGRTWLAPKRWYPVNGDSLRFRWDDTVGIQCSGMYPGKIESSDRGPVHYFTPEERQCLIVHRQEREGADYFNGQMAGRYNGVGLRDRLYWYWFLKSNTFALMNNYLERYSNGLTIFRYDASNPEAKAEMTEAAQKQWASAAMLIPTWASNAQINDVERIEASTAAPSLLQELVTNYYDSVIEKTILGQELTHGTAPTGMGSGVSESHEDTMAMIVKFDALNLQASLQTDLINILYRWNYPNMNPGRLILEVETPNAGEVLEQAQILASLGLPVDGEQLYEVTKLGKPQMESAAVSQNQPMAPAAVGNIPAGVPATGPAGPEGMVPQQQGQPMPQPVQGQPPQGAAPQQVPVQMKRATDPEKYQASAYYGIKKELETMKRMFDQLKSR